LTFAPYLERWQLVPDGDSVVTRASRLLPVRFRGVPAMLKLAASEEERAGAAVMEWWSGDGAAAVFARADDAILMERAEGRRSLADMARNGRDDEACQLLCAAVLRLHKPRTAAPPPLASMEDWFRDLWPAAETRGGVLARSAEAAKVLLSEPLECVVLHGDMHHGNVLDFGDRGWLAIDPKALRGERGFDYANIFTNPDLDDPAQPVAVDPSRFARRLDIVAEVAQLERTRLLQWILAWTGLSAAWYLGDGDAAEVDLRIAEYAAAALARP
jgi:streptomycin 6-kinase